MKYTFNNIMRGFFKMLSGMVFVCSIILFSMIILYQNMLPESFKIIEGSEFSLDNLHFVNSSKALDYSKTSFVSLQSGASERVEIKLFNIIPVKNTRISVIDEPELVAGGTPFGIKLFTKGVMVVDITGIEQAGGTAFPAKLAGINEGDVLLSLDSQEVCSNEDVARIIEGSGGRALCATIKRDGKIIKTVLTPASSKLDGKYKCGIWVRDSSAGIGTLTYYLEDDLRFAGLGHGICDIDTGKLFPISHGEVCDVSINSVAKGHIGAPGELRGSFISESSRGRLMLNNEAGIFGILNSAPDSKRDVKLCLKQDIKIGPAQIVCTLDSGGAKVYNINIDKLDLNPNTMTKNMIITVTDEELLKKTGGIVQGMSGSPILQDGKLCGAVTHVFVNNPQRGYGIFAENMLDFTNQL